MTVTICDYAAGQLESWLRCRALAYMRSQFADEISGDRGNFGDKRVLSLVACDQDQVVGIAETVLCPPNAQRSQQYGLAATTPVAILDTLAVHPDYQRQGIARRLLATTVDRLADFTGDLLIYTRDDVPANRLYQTIGAQLVYTAYLVTGHSPANAAPTCATFRPTGDRALQLVDRHHQPIAYGRDQETYLVGRRADIAQLTDVTAVVPEHVYVLRLF